jgi:HSP20 family protein
MLTADDNREESTMAKAAKKRASKKPVARTKATKTQASETPAKGGTEAPAAGTVLTPFADVERAFESFLSRRWPRILGGEWPRLRDLSSALERQLPSVDIVDRPKEVFVRAELPGVNRKDLDVSIVERMLTIKGSSRKEEQEEKEGYFRQEIRSGTFSRSVQLPADVNAAKAEATFKNGVLELRLPKTRVTPPKQIPLE